MKHIKLFEQFEEDSWWEEESPFDNIETKLKIIKYKNGFDSYYITESTIPKNGKIKIFNDIGNEYDTDAFDFNPTILEHTFINIFDYMGLEHMVCQYKDLPKEIKDRLI